MINLRAALASLILLSTSLETAIGAPANFVDHYHNGREPQYRSGVVSFLLPVSDCSETDYDNRVVNDCYHGNDRSMIKSEKLFYPGQAGRYTFDLYVSPNLRYEGGPNRRSSLSIADWRRDDTSQNNLYRFYLDARRGVMFEDRPCIPPSQFGQWNRIEVIIRWAQSDGFLQVSCNNSPIVVQRDINTIVPENCYLTETYQCSPRAQQVDHPIEMRLGLLHQGYGEFDYERGLSPAGRRLLEPVEVHMRNISVDRIELP